MVVRYTSLGLGSHPLNCINGPELIVAVVRNSVAVKAWTSQRT
jgi:hypothetical protein